MQTVLLGLCPLASGVHQHRHREGWEGGGQIKLLSCQAFPRTCLCEAAAPAPTWEERLPGSKPALA